MNRQYKTIGILIAGSFSLFDPPICKGIRAAAQELGIGTVFIPMTLGMGADVKTPIDSQILTAFAASATLDGVIIFDAELRSYFSDSVANKIIETFSHLPSTFIGYSKPGQHRVNADHYNGMLDLMEHVLTSCGYKQIAFVKGIENTDSANELYRGYLDALKTHHIDFDHDLVVEGNFRISGGLRAAREILDERGLRPDVIVCSNDETALGVVQELQVRNIKVPEEIAVTGFDNSTAAIVSTPPLTTVDKSLHQMGRNALNLLISKLDNPESVQSVILPTRLVVRESTIEKNNQFTEVAPSSIWSKPTQKILAISLPASLSQNKRNKLVHLFVLDCQNYKSRFIEYFSTLLDTVVARTYKNNWLEWKLALNTWLKLAENLPSDDSRQQVAVLILSRAQALITEQVVTQHIGSERTAKTLKIIERELVPFSSTDNLMVVLRQSLEEYDVLRCYLGELDTHRLASGQIRLAYSYGATSGQKDQRSDQLLPFSEMLHNAIASAPNLCWMAQHITFEGSYIGYMLSATNNFEDFVYDIIRVQGASVLKMMSSIKNLERHTHELEQAVSNRTLDLQLVMSEKDDQLNMVIHDLRNPLSAINLNLRLMSLSTEAKDHERTNELIERVVRSTASMKQLIEHLYAQNAQADNGLKLSIAPVDINQLVVEAHERCSVHAANKSILIDLVQTSEPAIANVDQLMLVQAIENLISNAVKFSYSDQHIEMIVQCTDEFVLITIRDEGQGLAAGDLKQIFGRYQKLSAIPTAGESSTGLGLYIVQKLVTAMDGEISAESPGKELGASFTIKLKRVS